ncbi:MAG: type II secretion system F family protein [Deltaproteobacteria bacterium]|nr:type II secretion system F family protein [Deltaproteobacteria bacterium]
MGFDVLTFYAILGCWAVASFLLTYLIIINRPEAIARPEGREEQIPNAVMRIALPIARMLAPLHRNAANTPRGRDLNRTLVRAGRPFGLTVPEFLCLRYVAIVAGALFGWAIAFGFTGRGDPVYVAGGVVLFLMLPGSRLKGMVEWRRVRIFRDMPYVLDLLVLSTEAGLDFSSAMNTVVEKGPSGPLVDEFRVAHQEVTLGKSRADSLRAMAERIDLAELTSFILALIQAEQLGASVGKILRIMSEQMRIKRFTIAEEMAGKVPVKLMAPLFVCIFPASFLVLGVPIYLKASLGGLS